VRKYLVVSDVHANLPALEAVLEDAPDWDEVVFLLGNHDREILHLDAAADPEGPHREWKHWTREQLSEADRRRLERFSATHNPLSYPIACRRLDSPVDSGRTSSPRSTKAR